jgi:hypothetical protein
MKIYNATPHTISIISRSDCEFVEASRKFVAFTPPIPVLVIPSSGMKSVFFETIQKENNIENIIPGFEKKIVGIEELPDGYDIYIVSALYASAYKVKGGDKAIFTVADPVYKPDNNMIIGCLGIMNPDIQ